MGEYARRSRGCMVGSPETRGRRHVCVAARTSRAILYSCEEIDARVKPRNE
jgi:hypothetical protein